MAHRVQDLVARKELTVLSGRIIDFAVTERKVTATWIPRGARYQRRLTVDAVINCTGLGGDIQTSGQRLIRSLLQRGMIRADPLGLGLDVDDRSQVMGADWTVQAGLFAVGALTRGQFWEIVSVPDIRVQAAAVATTIGDRLRAIRTPVEAQCA